MPRLTRTPAELAALAEADALARVVAASESQRLDRQAEARRLFLVGRTRPQLTVSTNPGYLRALERRRHLAAARVLPEPGFGRLEWQDGAL